MQGVNPKDFLEELEYPINKQEKYLYQINVKLDMLLKMLDRLMPVEVNIVQEVKTPKQRKKV